MKKRKRRRSESLGVESLVDLRRDGFDFGAEFVFDAVEVEAVLEGDEVDSEAEMAEATRAADAMEICLRVFGEVEVDDNVD